MCVINNSPKYVPSVERSHGTHLGKRKIIDSKNTIGRGYVSSQQSGIYTDIYIYICSYIYICMIRHAHKKFVERSSSLSQAILCLQLLSGRLQGPVLRSQKKIPPSYICGGGTGRGKQQKQIHPSKIEWDRIPTDPVQ